MDIDECMGKFVAVLDINQCDLTNVRVRNEVYNNVKSKAHTLIVGNAVVAELGARAATGNNRQQQVAETKRMREFINEIMQVQEGSGLHFLIEMTKGQSKGATAGREMPGRKMKICEKRGFK